MDENGVPLLLPSTKPELLLALPTNAVFGVFDEDAVFGELVADLVGAGEVALTLGKGALGYQSVNSLVGKGIEGEDRLGDFGRGDRFRAPRRGRDGRRRRLSR